MVSSQARRLDLHQHGHDSARVHLLAARARQTDAYLLPGIPLSIAEDMVKHTFLSSTTSLWEVLYQHDLATDARALSAEVPVFCLHGTRDSTAPVAGILRLAEGRPGWDVALLDGVGHHPWLQQPQPCREAILRVLGDACDVCDG